MTPDEVVAASGGAVHRVVFKPSKHPDALKLHGVECIGSYNSGAFRFILNFEFDRKTHGVQRVELMLLDNKKEPELLEAMQGKYGACQKDRPWIDAANGNYIYLDYVAGMAVVDYDRLLATETVGL